MMEYRHAGLDRLIRHAGLDPASSGIPSRPQGGPLFDWIPAYADGLSMKIEETLMIRFLHTPAKCNFGRGQNVSVPINLHSK